jgi:hypothetical protein
MSEKTTDMAGWVRAAGVGALLLAAAVYAPSARAACNVGPFTDVEVEYYATNAIGTNLPALYVGVGATNVYYANGTFEANPTNSTWTLPTGATTNREFKLQAWFDCDGNGTYTNTEQHRIIDVKVVDFVQLLLTNSACSNGVVDVTRADEAAAASNTLYLSEETNGTAEMHVLATR